MLSDFGCKSGRCASKKKAHCASYVKSTFAPCLEATTKSSLRTVPVVVFEDIDSLVKCLKFCTVQELRLVSSSVDEQLLRCLFPVKDAWREGRVVAAPRSFSTENTFTFAFSEVLLCREICLEEYEPRRFTPKSFMRLPAMLHCRKLDVSRLRPWPDALVGFTPYSLRVNDIIEWFGNASSAKWDEPRQLDVAEHQLDDDRKINGFLDALKKAFLAAKNPSPRGQRYLQNTRSNERLDIHAVAGARASSERVIVVERK
ncbi:hypothetical protein AAVH_21893 [Aphelenchoides avenae]|nr:hypothetical protein AAVH_21893 [Aphelenchus avenae]